VGIRTRELDILNSIEDNCVGRAPSQENQMNSRVVSMEEWPQWTQHFCENRCLNCWLKYQNNNVQGAWNLDKKQCEKRTLVDLIETLK